MDLREIGEVIKFHRKMSGLSREGLAALAGVGKTVIFDVEKGKQTIRLTTLSRILQALNIEIRLESPLMQHYQEAKDAEGDRPGQPLGGRDTD
ncbi:MAG: transcriptional regulator [Acidobacteria bacterium]|nr:MAG: transcriptional regulator [Acidobacteriota bacterium]